MTLRQRRIQSRDNNAEVAAMDCAGADKLNELHMAAQHFLQAGDDAINKALAHGDSEAFLTANRQEGGQ